MNKEEIEKTLKDMVENEPDLYDWDISLSLAKKAFNLGLEVAAENVETFVDSSETFQGIDEQSILKNKL